MRDRSPATLDWIYTLDEASGVEGEWALAAELNAATRDLLRIAGDTYLPFLLANRAAMERGDKTVSMTARGMPYTQAPFKYQVHCLQWLREEFDTLSPPDRKRAARLLEETGCGPAFGL
jgi:hypothetical protein